jgi:hypothetical protein
MAVGQLRAIRAYISEFNPNAASIVASICWRPVTVWSISLIEGAPWPERACVSW